MGKLVVSEFITLDGIIENPGGSEDLSPVGAARPSKVVAGQLRPRLHITRRSALRSPCTHSR